MTVTSRNFAALCLISRLTCGLGYSGEDAAREGPVEGPSLVLWLDAHDVRGPSVSRWADKSRYGNHARQPIGPRQPTWTGPGTRERPSAVRFSADQHQFLRVPRHPPLDVPELTAFVVARVESSPTNMWLFGKNTFGPRWTGYGIAVEGPTGRAWPHLGLGRAGPAANGYLKLRGGLGDLALVELRYDRKRLCAAVSGKRQLRALVGRLEANDRDLLIGAGPQSRPAVEFLSGEISELLLYNRALDPDEEEQTRLYLVEKYGLTLVPEDATERMVVHDNGYLPVTVENPATPQTRTLSAKEAQAVLRRDWRYQAGGRPTRERVEQEIRRARRLAERLKRAEPPLDLAGELAELTRLESIAATVSEASDVDRLYFAVRRIKRRILFQNPRLDFDRLLFIDQPYPEGPEWKHESVHRMGHRAVPGGRLLVLEGLHPGGRLRQLFPSRPGSFWRPELSFDGRRVLFSYKAHDESSFHLYEIDLDGTGLRRLTDSAYDDIDPIYLPDGHIVFTSTRGNSYVRCGPYIYSYVLARCDPDGRNVYLISVNSEPDFVPALLDDGRIVYSRWEYSDKDQLRIQSLWTVNQDGTGTAVLWGNQSIWPDHLAEPRPIPGSHRVMFTGVGHHDWFSGSVGIVDPARGTDFPHGLTKVTCDLPWAEVPRPPVDRCESARYEPAGRFTGYLGAYPLSEEDFLVSARGAGDQFRIYLMDVDGNRELIWEGRYNAWYPIPVKPRVVPPRQPSRVAWPGTGPDRQPVEPGTFYNPDVYQGVPEIPRGRVKYLRVIEQQAKTYSTWQKTFRMSGPPVSIVQEEAVKRIVSTVPVENDGSVYFRVPAGKALYFQLLDGDYRALQTMRSFTGLMPGERRSCIGCHETQSTTPPVYETVPALRRAPTEITPPPWGDETIGYERFVQPVLDRYCGECHTGDAEGREALDLTLRPGWDVFHEPYLTLVGPAIWVPRGWGGVPATLPKPAQPGFGIAATIPVYRLGERYDDHNDPATVETLRPLQYLAAKSRLIDLATSGQHYDVRVDPLSLRRLTAWVDTNSPYLGEEEIRALPDPEFPGVERLPVRPRLSGAPRVERP